LAILRILYQIYRAKARYTFGHTRIGDDNVDSAVGRDSCLEQLDQFFEYENITRAEDGFSGWDVSEETEWLEASYPPLDTIEAATAFPPASSRSPITTFAL
jgi:hypothetical protein